VFYSHSIVGYLPNSACWWHCSSW